ncbi:hypothetical protein A2U01_0113986, partial [Trifolium medium]|nr:hypothetical protein [Trifolium medium]
MSSPEAIEIPSEIPTSEHQPPPEQPTPDQPTSEHH